MQSLSQATDMRVASYKCAYQKCPPLHLVNVIAKSVPGKDFLENLNFFVNLCSPGHTPTTGAKPQSRNCSGLFLWDRSLTTHESTCMRQGRHELCIDFAMLLVKTAFRMSSDCKQGRFCKLQNGVFEQWCSGVWLRCSVHRRLRMGPLGQPQLARNDVRN